MDTAKNNDAAVLVTGGAGYIGSHTAVELLKAGRKVVILDNLANSSESVIDRIAEISGTRPAFVRGDIRDKALVASLLKEHGVGSVIHFAALKAVGESVAEPLSYYENNVSGTVALLEAMSAAGVKTLVFSSSATVYGDPDSVPIPETAALRPANPYGQTKFFVEQILRDLAASDLEWRIALLRYFNPIGAHESGLIGEDPKGVPNNLLPFVAKVASGQLPELTVFGSDWPTPDGSGVRDYLHVVDLALGHLKALDRLAEDPGCHAWNLGTGRGASVLEIIKAFENVTGAKVPFRIAERRPGDIAVCYADPSKAERELGWKAERTVEDACRDMWKWQKYAETLR